MAIRDERQEVLRLRPTWVRVTRDEPLRTPWDRSEESTRQAPWDRSKESTRQAPWDRSEESTRQAPWSLLKGTARRSPWSGSEEASLPITGKEMESRSLHPPWHRPEKQNSVRSPWQNEESEKIIRVHVVDRDLAVNAAIDQVSKAGNDRHEPNEGDVPIPIRDPEPGVERRDELGLYYKPHDLKINIVGQSKSFPELVRFYELAAINAYYRSTGNDTSSGLLKQIYAGLGGGYEHGGIGLFIREVVERLEELAGQKDEKQIIYFVNKIVNELGRVGWQHGIGVLEPLIRRVEQRGAETDWHICRRCILGRVTGLIKHETPSGQTAGMAAAPPTSKFVVGRVKQREAETDWRICRECVLGRVTGLIEHEAPSGQTAGVAAAPPAPFLGWQEAGGDDPP